jgi:hypothetical protein
MSPEVGESALQGLVGASDVPENPEPAKLILVDGAAVFVDRTIAAVTLNVGAVRGESRSGVPVTVIL